MQAVEIGKEAWLSFTSKFGECHQKLPDLCAKCHVATRLQIFKQADDRCHSQQGRFADCSIGLARTHFDNAAIAARKT